MTDLRSDVRQARFTQTINQHGTFDPAIPMPLIKASGMGVDFGDCGIKGAMRLQIINARKAA